MDVLSALHDWPVAAALRRSAVAYPAVSALHVLGIGLLLGAILPLDLRLMGGLRRVPLAAVLPVLRGTAAVGFGLAAATGVLLFSVNPADYAANPALRLKLVLIALAVANAALADRRLRRLPDGAAMPAGVRAAALASAVLWLGALFAGRWIGFL